MIRTLSQPISLLWKSEAIFWEGRLLCKRGGFVPIGMAPESARWNFIAEPSLVSLTSSLCLNLLASYFMAGWVHVLVLSKHVYTYC